MKKQWVIPDLHGCSQTLQALITEQIRPSRSDVLYFLGDYIDRGPDSKGVIDYIITLQENEYEVKVLKGNHEDYFLNLCCWEILLMIGGLHLKAHKYRACKKPSKMGRIYLEL